MKNKEKLNLKAYNMLVNWYFKTHKNKNENLVYWHNLLNNLLLTNSYESLKNVVDTLNNRLNFYEYECNFVYDIDNNTFNLIGKIDL